jgi:hypothetical protein
MSKVKIISARIGEVVLCSKGFVLAKFNEDNKIELADVKEQIAAAEKLTQGGDYVSMMDGGLTIDVSEEAMTYVAKYESKRWKAFAIVVRSISERILANYFIKFKKPARPTKVFTNPERAIEWLEEYLEFEKPEAELMYRPALKAWNKKAPEIPAK